MRICNKLYLRIFSSALSLSMFSISALLIWGCRTRKFSEEKGVFGLGNLVSETKGNGFQIVKSKEAQYVKKDSLQAIALYIHGVNTTGNDEPFRHAQEWAAKGYYPMQLLWTRNAANTQNTLNVMEIFSDFSNKGVAKMTLEALGSKANKVISSLGDSLFPNKQEDVVWLALLEPAAKAFLENIQIASRQNGALKEVRVICHSMGCQMGIRTAQMLAKWNANSGQKLNIRLDLLDPYVSDRTFQNIHENSHKRGLEALNTNLFSLQKKPKEQLSEWLADFKTNSKLPPTIYSSITAEAFCDSFSKFANVQRMSDNWLQGAGFGKKFAEQHNRIRDAYFGSFASPSYPILTMPDKVPVPAFYAGLSNEELAKRNVWHVAQRNDGADLDAVALHSHFFGLEKKIEGRLAQSIAEQSDVQQSASGERLALKKAADAHSSMSVFRDAETNPQEEEDSIEKQLRDLKESLAKNSLPSAGKKCSENLSNRSEFEMASLCRASLQSNLQACSTCLGIEALSLETRETVKECASKPISVYQKLSKTNEAKKTTYDTNIQWTWNCFKSFFPQ